MSTPVAFGGADPTSVLTNFNRKVKALGSGAAHNSSIQSYVDQSLIPFTNGVAGAGGQSVKEAQKIRLNGAP
jgi:hypothetical protein